MSNTYHVKIKISALRRIIKECLNKQRLSEEAWVPGRYYPSEGEPLDASDASRLGDNLGEMDEEMDEELDEVDLDPSNNPGRPADAYDFLGMHPKATAAMSHPYADGSGYSSGGSTGGGGGSSVTTGDVGGSDETGGNATPGGATPPTQKQKL